MVSDAVLKTGGNNIARLPRWGNKADINDTHYPPQPRETCLWIPTNIVADSEISSFVKAAKKEGCREEESLTNLMNNHFNAPHAMNSLTISEKPNYLLYKNPVDVSNTFCKIIIGNRRFGRNRRRCFNKIRAEFPGSTIGDILDFYMRNKLKIKRRIAKYKRQIKKLNSLPSEDDYTRIMKTVAPDYQIDEEDPVEKSNDDDDCVIVSVSYEINAGWTEKDYQLLYHGLNDYGYNYSRLAAVLGTKTSSMIENFIKQQQVV